MPATPPGRETCSSRNSSVREAEVDFQFGIFAITDPFAFECEEIVHRGLSTIEFDEQIPITRFVIEGEDQMQTMSGKRLAQPFRGAQNLRAQRRVPFYECRGIGRY